MLPLYEAKMVGAYNHRAADVVKSATALKRQNQPSYLDECDLRDSSRLVMPLYWVAEDQVPAGDAACRLAFLAISSPTNARTLTASLLPTVAAGHSVFLVNPGDEVDMCLLLAQMNSFALDFVVRQKLSGLNVSFYYVQQFPFLPPSVFESVAPWAPNQNLDEWVVGRVLSLTLTAVDMQPLAETLDGEVQPWDSRTRQRIAAELDAALFHLYGLGQDDIEYIMETFPIVKRKDEADSGEYRTKRLILEAFDAMQQAIDLGDTYRSPWDSESPGEEDE
jgi:hypothetical protein